MNENDGSGSSGDDIKYPACSEKKVDDCNGNDEEDIYTKCYWDETSCKTVDASSACTSLTKKK
jgi:hypothetical protein